MLLLVVTAVYAIGMLSQKSQSFQASSWNADKVAMLKAHNHITRIPAACCWPFPSSVSEVFCLLAIGLAAHGSTACSH